ncbi:MAG TPA: Ig-like domain-containing protein [Vicinamibacteria bacterium]
MRRIVPAAAVVLALLPSAARAQSRYDIYGDPVDVTVQSLADNPQSYDGRAVRVKGKFELGATMSQRSYVLRESVVAQVMLVPVQEIAGQFEDQALKYSGREVEVTGVFKANPSAGPTPGMGMLAGAIQFWECMGPPEEVKGDIKANLVTLENLVSGAGRYDGKTIRVYGRFRGKNLYGDLPSRSQRQSRDWVVKDDLFAIWVTGRKPKGSGFELDINMKRDTEKWIQVVGVPDTIRGVTYLRAMQVTLGKPAEELVASLAGPAKAPAPLPTPPPPPKPPVVVFALPLDGEADVPSNGRFQIQFSKDMEEASFKGRVVLRYAPPVRPGDRDFDGAKMTYDGGRKALAVDPGDVLRPGREVQILLLPGIVDIEGQELTPRPGRDGGPLGATDFLRFQVVTASLFGAR